MSKFYRAMCIIGVVAVVIAAGIPLVKTIDAQDGDVKYCYVEYYNQSTILPPAYIIWGFVPWRSNVKIGVTQTSADAEALMKSSTMCQKK